MFAGQDTVRNVNSKSPFDRIRSPKGFTLMEMLVVLVIVGLISTFLMQGLTHVLHLRVRFSSQSLKQTKESLRSYWFRSVASALTPDHPNEKNVFSGTVARFQGMTFAPLKGMIGVPTGFVMELSYKEGKIFLNYKEEGDNDSWELADWTGEKGEFSYLDDESRWRQQWPPPLGKLSQLPRGILLEIHDARGTQACFAAIPGIRDPKPRLKDLLGL